MKFIDTSPSALYTCPSSLRLDEMRLSYKVDLNHDNFHNRSAAYIDAQTGETIKIEKKIREVYEAGGRTLTGYYGSKSITLTQSNDRTTYYALQREGRNLSLFNCVENELCPIVSNTNNYNFGTIARDEDQLMAAYWGMEQIWDFFSQVFKRNGYDNKGSLIEVLGYNEANAFWAPGVISQAVFGFLTAFDLSSLDVVAHEFMHGVIETEAQLVYQDEPGTIAEAFCDCIAIFAYASIMNQADYWEIGSESRIFTRSAKWPKYYRQPDTYKGEYWYYGTQDNGGVHHNNGVINRMFYLLAAGGHGTNDFGVRYNATGINIEKAAQIVYRATTNYLTKNSNFKDL